MGRFYEQMPAEHFWAMHAASLATGGLLIILFGRILGRLVSTAEPQPLRPSALDPGN
jgi:hypothetical protein